MASLTINFTQASPVPSDGYRVKYWPTSNISNITTVTPNPTSSPVVITGLTESSYAGTIESSCGSGQYSSTQSFSAAITNPSNVASVVVNSTCYSSPGDGMCGTTEFTFPATGYINFLNSSSALVIPDYDIEVTAHLSDSTTEVFTITAFQTPLDAIKKCYFGFTQNVSCSGDTVIYGPTLVSYSFTVITPP